MSNYCALCHLVCTLRSSLSLGNQVTEVLTSQLEVILICLFWLIVQDHLALYNVIKKDMYWGTHVNGSQLKYKKNVMNSKLSRNHSIIFLGNNWLLIVWSLLKDSHIIEEAFGGFGLLSYSV